MNTDIFGEVISTYTRTQALEDGLLVDLNQFIPVKESGYKYPLACTASVWAIIEKTAKNGDLNGIIWDVLHMSRNYMVKRWETGGLFQVKIGRKLHTFKIECGPGDDFSPVLTVLGSEES